MKYWFNDQKHFPFGFRKFTLFTNPQKNNERKKSAHRHSIHTKLFPEAIFFTNERRKMWKLNVLMRCIHSRFVHFFFVSIKFFFPGKLSPIRNKAENWWECHKRTMPNQKHSHLYSMHEIYLGIHIKRISAFVKVFNIIILFKWLLQKTLGPTDAPRISFLMSDRNESA